mmetsp:Transcript_15793/g.30537  ORF Transcript_15793/g.30537 Transcript_15793/m.30537 type:complete len:102 (+) Transcript_15793:411-716(+)
MLRVRSMNASSYKNNCSREQLEQAEAYHQNQNQNSSTHHFLTAVTTISSILEQPGIRKPGFCFISKKVGSQQESTTRKPSTLQVSPATHYGSRSRRTQPLF